MNECVPHFLPPTFYRLKKSTLSNYNGGNSSPGSDPLWNTADPTVGDVFGGSINPSLQ